MEALGRPLLVGSLVTGLMVWRDVDVVVDARDADAQSAWDAMLPILVRCDDLHYRNDDENGRYYFVVRVTGWKLDVSVYHRGVPQEIDAFQQRLLSELDDERRLAILRLKEAWWQRPEYPDVVGGYEIYTAVLDHGVRTPEELAAHLA